VASGGQGPTVETFGEQGGRYRVFGQIAAGGMATVHLGRLVGAAGFARTVAIKRLRPHLAEDPQFVSSFVDEARLAACIRHPNVIPTLDVVMRQGEVLVVMEYVQGESLSRLARGGRPPLPIAAAIASQMLSGLHAAHEAKSPKGAPLHLVHRDVSPQNVVVGTDGVARVLDFGVAKATWRSQDTRDGLLKGKLAYMSPEQLNWRPLDRRADIFAASIVIWETLTGERLFAGDNAGDTAVRVLAGKVRPPSEIAPALPSALDAIVLRGLAQDPDDRFATALEMAVALEAVAPLATARELGAWVEQRSHEALAERASMVRELEESTNGGDPPVASPKAASDRAELPTAQILEAPTQHVLSRALTPARPAVRKRWAVGAALLSVTAITAGAVALTRPAHKSASGPVAQASASSVEADPAPVPVLPAALTAPDTASAPQAMATPVALPSAAPHRAHPAGPKPPTGSSGRTTRCDPPYTVGPDGVHRFRPECM
jgi:serine/threonine-protein kinase